MSQPSSPTSSREDLSTAKILTWARGLETFERVDFVYLLMHSLFPTELRYIHGIIDSLLKRDESLCSASVHQANDFARLSHFYENHDPHAVIAEDGLRRQFIVDLSALHPLNFYCADIFYNVLMRAELATWTFDKKSEKMLKELILITTMVARHAAFRFDNRLYTWNVARSLTTRLKVVQAMDDSDTDEATGLPSDFPNHIPPLVVPPDDPEDVLDMESLVSTAPVLSAAGPDRLVNGYREPSASLAQPAAHSAGVSAATTAELPPPPPPPSVPVIAAVTDQKPLLCTAFPPLGNPSATAPTTIRPPPPPLNYANIRPKITATISHDTPTTLAQSDVTPQLKKHDSCPVVHERTSSLGHYQGRQPTPADTQRPVTWPPENTQKELNGPRRGNFSTQRSSPGDIADSSSNMAVRRSSHEFLDTMDSATGHSESTPLMETSVAGSSGKVVKPVGTFPNVYSISMQNGPRFASNLQQSGGSAFLPLPNFGVPVNNVMSCFVCGGHGHNGTICPKKVPLDPEQIEKFCPLRRDAKQYPEGRNPKARHPGGGHHGHHHS